MKPFVAKKIEDSFLFDIGSLPVEFISKDLEHEKAFTHLGNKD